MSRGTRNERPAGISRRRHDQHGPAIKDAREWCGPVIDGKAPDGSATAAVNIRCLEGVDLAALKRVPYDGRSS